MLSKLSLVFILPFNVFSLCSFFCFSLITLCFSSAILWCYTVMVLSISFARTMAHVLVKEWIPNLISSLWNGQYWEMLLVEEFHKGKKSCGWNGWREWFLSPIRNCGISKATLEEIPNGMTANDPFCLGVTLPQTPEDMEKDYYQRCWREKRVIDLPNDTVMMSSQDVGWVLAWDATMKQLEKMKTEGKLGSPRVSPANSCYKEAMEQPQQEKPVVVIPNSSIEAPYNAPSSTSSPLGLQKSQRYNPFFDAVLENNVFKMDYEGNEIWIHEEFVDIPKLNPLSVSAEFLRHTVVDSTKKRAR